MTSSTMMSEPAGTQRPDVLRRSSSSPVFAVANASCALGREVVDDLQHRGALVAGALLAGQHVDVGRQVTGGLRGGQRVDAVGQHADRDADAGDPEALSGRVDRLDLDGLGHDRTGIAGEGVQRRAGPGERVRSSRETVARRGALLGGQCLRLAGRSSTRHGFAGRDVGAPCGSAAVASTLSSGIVTRAVPALS